MDATVWLPSTAARSLHLVLPTCTCSFRAAIMAFILMSNLVYNLHTSFFCFGSIVCRMNEITAY